MAEEKNEQNFVGGSMAGLPVAPASSVSAPRPTKNWQIRDKGVTRTVGAPVPISSVSREPLDAKAVILFKDFFGRPYELHEDGAVWEERQGIERRFKPGDELWIVMRTSLRDEYIQANNAPEFLVQVGEHLPKAPTSVKIGPVPYLESYMYRARVIEHQPGKTVTVGLCPVYACQVIDGPAQGLRFLAYPSDLMDNDNLDGYGVDRISRRKREGLAIPPGFTVKEKEKA